MRAADSSKPKNFTPKQLEDIRVLSKAGASYEELGRRHKCSPKLIQKYVPKTGAEIHYGRKWSK
jgi:DNA-binding CsgD family transcriptional regulator